MTAIAGWRDRHEDATTATASRGHPFGHSVDLRPTAPVTSGELRLLHSRTPLRGSAAPTRLTAVMTGRCRFDDITSGRGWVFDSTDQILTADSPRRVSELLSTVDDLTNAGAWAWGYVSYEAAPAFDSAFQVHESSDGNLPLACFAIGPPPKLDHAITLPPVRSSVHPSTWRLDWKATDYCQRVDDLREAIAGGEAYQVNLTSHFRGTIHQHPLHLYASLAHAQRGAYNAYLHLDLGIPGGPIVIASASPELFFQWEANNIVCRPMKGTARRAFTRADDERTRAELVSSSKQQAENLMIVDLIRNDLSRLAELGSVRVLSLFDAEKFETVWQLTSTVSAQLPTGTGLHEIFARMFPCGSVTGAPKAAAMSLIARHEASSRGVYCGAIGMVAPPSSEFRARFSVPIRTATIRIADRSASYGVGAGITWASDPREEFDEIQAKAAILTEPSGDFQLLETMRFESTSGIRNLARHVRRLSESASYFDIPLDLQVVYAVVEAACRTFPPQLPQRVRLLVTRGGSVSIDSEPLASSTSSFVGLVIDDQVTKPNRWMRHKTTHRWTYENAAHRHTFADDVILVDDSGYAIETTRANLAARIDGRWVTPPLSRGGLPGVERQRSLDTGLLRELDIHITDLTNTNEIAVVSSLRGWRQAYIIGSPRRRKDVWEQRSNVTER